MIQKYLSYFDECISAFNDFEMQFIMFTYLSNHFSGYVGVINRSQQDIDENADFDNTDNTIRKVKDWSEFGRVKDNYFYLDSLEIPINILIIQFQLTKWSKRDKRATKVRKYL